MKYTSNYNLNLPERQDPSDIDVLNENTIDIDKILDEINREKNQNKRDIKELERLKADISYVDSEVAKAGKVDSVNDKIGDVVLTGRDIKLQDGITTTVTAAINRKADTTYVSREISDLKMADIEIKKDIEGLSTGKSNIGHKHSANDVNETYNKKFVTSSEKDKINRVDQKADITYVDKEVKNLSSKLSDAIKIKTYKSIYRSNWSSYDGMYRVRISDSDVTSNSVVDVNIHRDSYENAKRLLPMTESISGAFYMFATKQPEGTIKIDYKIVKEV